eukprot:12513676-Alexandrium_andersonii.AAC.1
MRACCACVVMPASRARCACRLFCPCSVCVGPASRLCSMLCLRSAPVGAAPLLRAVRVLRLCCDSSAVPALRLRCACAVHVM